MVFSLRPTSCSQYESQFLRRKRLSSVYWLRETRILKVRKDDPNRLLTNEYHDHESTSAHYWPRWTTRLHPERLLRKSHERGMSILDLPSGFDVSSAIQVWMVSVRGINEFICWLEMNETDWITDDPLSSSLTLHTSDKTEQMLYRPSHQWMLLQFLAESIPVYEYLMTSSCHLKRIRQSLSHADVDLFIYLR